SVNGYITANPAHGMKPYPYYSYRKSLNQGSSTFFSPRTPWLRETLSRDPHPHRPKFGPDINIIYLELSVRYTHTLPYTCLNRITNEQDYICDTKLVSIYSVYY